MPYHPQSANRLTERIHAAVRAVIARAEESTMLVACSGGTDSACLLYACAAVARQTGSRLVVGHVRHGVRPDDARDADIVRAMAAHLDLACRVVCLHDGDADQRRTPSEGAMRQARYRALAAVADDLAADAVLTGHTLDDQAETVLLHLVRGAGVDGLGGMAERTILRLPPDAATEKASERSSQPLRVIRPLLSVRRAETVAYCLAHDLTVVHDPTNDDERYTRNWLRHAILPALGARNPDVAPTLARTASTMRDDADFLSAETARAMARCECRTAQSCISINLSLYASEHVALRRRILREIMQEITGAMPRADDVDAIQRDATTSHSSAMRHVGGVACCLAFGRLALGCDEAVTGWVQGEASRRYPLFRGRQVIHDDRRLRLTLSDSLVVASTFHLEPAGQTLRTDIANGIVIVPMHLPDGYTAIVRNRAPADRFQPHSSAPPMLLRDYLKAHEIPAPVRDL
ncbi:MAG: tRNA lysidine(34) synthetase TilS, partial [Chloroflexota bacterium]|nr:tRNA lysidine(34) synthetase TilS [Chloroflexota bacterium]